MSTTATTIRSRLTAAEKGAIQAGEELTDGQVIWRKLRDGTGTWRYDFRMNQQRYKGVLGREAQGLRPIGCFAQSHASALGAMEYTHGLTAVERWFPIGQ